MADATKDGGEKPAQAPGSEAPEPKTEPVGGDAERREKAKDEASKDQNEDG